MDIKQRLTNFRPIVSGPVRVNGEDIAALIDDALREIERLEELVRGLQVELGLERTPVRRAQRESARSEKIEEYACRKCGVWYAGPNGFHECSEVSAPVMEQLAKRVAVLETLAHPPLGQEQIYERLEALERWRKS